MSERHANRCLFCRGDATFPDGGQTALLTWDVLGARPFVVHVGCIAHLRPRSAVRNSLSSPAEPRDLAVLPLEAAG